LTIASLETVEHEHERDLVSGTPGIYTSLVVCTAAIAALLLFVESLEGGVRAALVVIALGAWVALVAQGWARGSLPLRPVLIAIAITLLLAVATPSHQSKDVFSYTMYGRILTVHHHNPYSWYPMHFENDPMRQYVSAMWQRTPDVYGPAFTGVMGVLAPVIGTSTFLARFTYQLIALAAITALLLLLWRRTRNPVVLAFMGLHPLVAISVVNGGHPDAIIALAFLAAAILALERRPVLCGLACAVGVAINFSMIVAPVALGVWAARRWSRAEVVKLGAVTIAVGAAPYLVLHGWLQNAREHQQLISRASIWNPLASLLTDSFSMSITDLRSFMPKVTTVAAGLLLLFVLARYTGRRTPDLAMAAAIATFLVTSPWVMPWYAFAAFPLLAMRKPNLLTWSVTIYSALILVSDQYASLSQNDIGAFWHHILETALPLAGAATCAVAILSKRVATAD
jgi:hypothetical protein